MKRSTFYLAAALTCVAMYTPTAPAGVIAMPPPGPARVANADAVIVGKVEAIEPQDIKVGNMTYRIAVVKINQGVRGVKDAKTLRIGFIPPPMPVVGKGPIVISSGASPVHLVAGQEGLFILKKDAKEDFYTIGGVVGYFINSDKNADFAKEVQTAKAAAKMMENPLDSLKSKDADERLLGAALLIEKYRTYRGPNSKLEPIDAAQSKAIMQVLADADWQAQPNSFNSLKPNPVELFRRLNVTAKDGFTPPTDGRYQAAVHTWVRDNAAKYRIQGFVASGAK